MQVRDALVALLDAWLAVTSADRIFPAALDAIANPKCILDGKVCGLSW
jgi:hypothetical protein